mgnify:CR=1 FL=1
MRKFFRKIRFRYVFFTFFYTGLLLLVASPFFYIYYVNNGIPVFDDWIEEATITHLEAAGYSDDDIEEYKIVRPNYETNDDYYKAHVFVSFKSNPGVYYIYGKEKYFGDIVQFCEKEIVLARGNELVREVMDYSEDSCVAMQRDMDDSEE